MSSWHFLGLGDALTAQLPLARIMEAFAAEYSVAAAPAEAAIFIRYDSEGRLHCEVTVYFSPGAQALARRFDAEPCATPGRAGLERLCGVDGVLPSDQSGYSRPAPT
jgi:hypothetical protein